VGRPEPNGNLKSDQKANVQLSKNKDRRQNHAQPNMPAVPAQMAPSQKEKRRSSQVQTHMTVAVGQRRRLRAASVQVIKRQVNANGVDVISVKASNNASRHEKAMLRHACVNVASKMVGTSRQQTACTAARTHAAQGCGAAGARHSKVPTEYRQNA